MPVETNGHETKDKAPLKKPRKTRKISSLIPSHIFDVLRRPGGPCEEPKPDPIPNSAVKLLSANGTVSQDPGESVAARPAKHNEIPPHNLKPQTKQNAFIAGWSSPVARQAHNLKVVGSNPAPATKSPNYH